MLLEIPTVSDFSLDAIQDDIAFVWLFMDYVAWVFAIDGRMMMTVFSLACHVVVAWDNVSIAAAGIIPVVFAMHAAAS